MLLWKKLWHRQIKSRTWAHTAQKWQIQGSAPGLCDSKTINHLTEFPFCDVHSIKDVVAFKPFLLKKMLSWKRRRGLILLYSTWVALQEKCQVFRNTERKGGFKGKTDHSHKESDGQHLASLWLGCEGRCVNHKGMTNFLLCPNLPQPACLQRFWQPFLHLN